ncbi:MAG: baseplate J/gp47 family protein [Treponema sp.]|nr:baseplate J/gp47 family protein [Treponema sp.]
MGFSRDSLQVLKDRTLANYLSLFKPLDRTPRHNLISIMANVDAGLFHMLQGDLVFLSKQLFPDTAEGEYLRAHWSVFVPPLYATAAIGKAEVSGIAGKPVPAGTIFKSNSGKKYFSEKAFRIGDNGKVPVDVRAEEAGLDSNLTAGSSLSIVSAISSDINETSNVDAAGIYGGTDAESDAEYLSRVLVHLLNPIRYGQRGDYASWALDSTPEVSSAWEFKNFGVFGALLIQVINGSQQSGVFQVYNLSAVRDYISTVSPPIIFDVRTPALISINPEIKLLPQEDSQENRDMAEIRLKTYLQYTAEPGVHVTSGALRESIIDGVKITNATVKISGDITGSLKTTILEYPVLGKITWV